MLLQTRDHGAHDYSVVICAGLVGSLADLGKG